MTGIHEYVCDFTLFSPRLTYRQREQINPLFGTTIVTTSSIIAAISARVSAYRNRRRIAPSRPTLGYRELLDIGIYRGHIDRVASAENEAI